MQPSTGEKFQSFLDKNLQKSPFSQFGQVNREARITNTESKYGSDLANKVTSPESSIPVAIKGHTQVIGDRPAVDLKDHTPDEQRQYFEINTAIKTEGPVLERVKAGFKEVHTSYEEKLAKCKIDSAKFEVSGLKEIGGDGNPDKVFKKGNYFKPAEVAKFVSLDPLKQEGITTGIGGTNIENATGDNIDFLIEGLYGGSFKTKLDVLLDQRLESGRLGSDALKINIINLVASSGLPAVMTEDLANLLVKDSIKTALIQNPEEAVKIIKELSKDDTVITDIPGLLKNLQDATIKFILDEFALTNPEYFSVPTANITQISANRLNIVAALTSPTGSALLNKIGGTSTLTGLSNLSLMPEFQFSGLKIGPKNPTMDEKIDHFRMDPYRGLYESITGDMKDVLKTTSRAMALGDAKDIFNKIVKDGLIPATTETVDFDRLKAFATIENSLWTMINNPTTTPQLKTRLEKMQGSLVEYSTPRGLVVGLEKDLMFKIASGLSAAGVAIQIPELQEAIEEALKIEPTDKAIFERLAMVISTVTDTTQRTQLNDLLRSVSNLEVLREIASLMSGGDANVNEQYMLTLLNKFVLPTNKEAENAQALLDLLYAKTTGDTVINLTITGNNQIKEYLQKLLGTTTLKPELKVNGQASSGNIYARAHELFGTIRKGVEAGEWVDMSTKSDDQIKQYLVENFGILADSKQLDEALARFKEITLTGVIIKLSDVSDKAINGQPTEYGLNYTNLTRMLRHYITHGGEIKEIMKNFENMSLTKFMESVQNQANAKIGSIEGDAVNEQNRILSLEEQRAAVLKNYEELSGGKGFVNFLNRMKAAVPRIIKVAGFMAIATLGAAFPVIAGPIALGMAAVRIFAIYKTIKMGIPMVKEMWSKGDTKMAWAMATGVGVNVLVNALVPTPWGMGLGLIGETIGMDVFAASKMKKEAKIVVDAHTAYETGFDSFFGGLHPKNDELVIRKIAKSLNAVVATNPLGIDIATTLTNIKTARTAARNTGNMTLLREYSQIVESLVGMETKVQNVREANKDARKIYEDTNKTLMAYALASGATKLGFGVVRGGVAGWNEGEGGVVGALLGTIGISDYRTLLDFKGSLNPSDTDNTNVEGATITESNIEQVQDSLENQLDTVVKASGLDSDDSTIIGMVHTADGQTLAMIDLDGDPNTVESFIAVNEHGILDFREIISRTETGGGKDPVPGFERYSYTAESGDSQWSMVENVLRMRYPDATDQQIWNATGNVLQEATPSGVYEHLDRDHYGAVWVGDKLTLQSIEDMAPNSFARAEANLPVSEVQTGTQLPSISDSTLNFEFPALDVPTNITGALLFDSPEGPIVSGNMAFLTPYVVVVTTDDGTVTTTSSTTTQDDIKDEDNNQKIKDFIFGKPQEDTSTQQVTGETGQGNTQKQADDDTFKVVDNGIFDKNFKVIENTVAKIFVPQDSYTGAPAFEIDPSKVDVVSVDPDKGVTYITPDGERHFVAATDGVKFAFIGNEDVLVDASSGEQSIMTHVVDASKVITSAVTGVTSSISDASQNISETLNQVNSDVNDISNNRSENIAGINEIREDYQDTMNNPGIYPVYDSGFTGNQDVMISHDGVGGNAYFSTGSNLPVWLEAVTITGQNGNQVVPLENIVQIGETYIDYRDLETNEIHRYTGDNVVGVGYTYTIDQTTGKQIFNTDDPQQIDFQTETPNKPTIANVESPWWMNIVKTLLPN